MYTSSFRSRRIGICSFNGHLSRGNHEADFKYMDKTQISLNRSSSAERRVIHEVAATDFVVLGLPAINVKGELYDNSGPNDVYVKNPNNLVKVSSQSVLPTKKVSKYFKDTGFDFVHENNSFNMLNAAEQPTLPVKVKVEAPEGEEISVALENKAEKFPKFSQMRITNYFCSSEANVQKRNLLPLSTFKKNHIRLGNFLAQSPLPVKIEPTSFKHSEFGVIHEKNSCNSLNSSERPALPIKVKTETPEVAEESIVLEKYVENFSDFFQLKNTVSFCFSEANIQEKQFQYFSIPKDGTPCKLATEIHIPEELQIPSGGNLSTITPGLDKVLSESTGLIIPHSEKVDIVSDCLLTGNDKFSVIKDEGCSSHSLNLESEIRAAEPQPNPLSSSLLKVKPESVDSSLTCWQIPPCNNRGRIFEYEADLPSKFPLDILDHVPLKYRLGNSELPRDFFTDILNHIPLKYRMGISELPGGSPLGILDNDPLINGLESNVSEVGVHVKSENNFSEPSMSSDCCSFGSIHTKASPFSRRKKRKIASVTSDSCSFGSINTKASNCSTRRKKKKTATNSVEKAMEEDAPGLLQVLLDRGIQAEEIKLYGDIDDNDPLEETSYEDSFEELETLMSKLFSEHSSLLKFTMRRSGKRSKAVYCIASLISLIEQCRYLLFRQTPAEWGWCRDLYSFIFIFKTHNRIVLERPEYGYATYFFELVSSLPIDWQMMRLIKAMKLTNCSRTILLENKPLIVGEDLSEGEARVLEAYGWIPNTGFGTLLNYCDRVVHDRRNEMGNFDWRARIGKLLMDGYDGGCLVLTNLPEKVLEHMGSQTPGIKLEP